MDDDGIEAARITITRRFKIEDGDDGDLINVDFSDSLTLVEILGLLEFAKLSAAAEMIRDTED